ncbi:GvpL/GvpF family gas vesicle protein [Kibdelosporangium lantanae]|uniref:GvpL/GvpF family gas vesicle protein n=1 Tax=Kibdelosporangium lantanae TaxID=1497396 RepID=A0ABW3M9Z1_9PSEU
MSLRLHGVVRADHPLPADTSAHLVKWQDLAVVASVLPDTEVVTRADALKHMELLSSLVHEGSVVPLRFGTTAVDEDTIRVDVLQSMGAGLRGQLERFDGVAEVHVYVRFDEDFALNAVLYQLPAVGRAGRTTLAEQISAGERIAQQVVAWRKRQVDALLAPVSELARETSLLPEQEHTQDRRAFLLPLEDLPAVEKRVSTMSAEAWRAEFVGPLPAFSFLATAPAAAAPASSRWGW